MSTESTPRRPLPFHYLSLVKDEYADLIKLATKFAAARGFDLDPTAHGYDELANLVDVKRFLDAPHALVELPLHTAARLMQDPEYGRTCKAIVSPYTFIADAAKIVLYHYGKSPADISRLVCTAKDSIATQLFRDYALRKGWDIRKIDSNTDAQPDYPSVLALAQFTNPGVAPKALKNSAFLLSGTGVVGEMEQFRLRNEASASNLRLSRVDDIYKTVKEGWRKSLGAFHWELPELPGTIIVARHEAHAPPFFQPLLDAVSIWSEDKASRRAAAMGPPHIGTPTSIVAIVVYMELLAREALRRGVEPLPALDYTHFSLVADDAHWTAEKARTVRAVELGANWLFKSRAEYVSDALDLAGYFRKSLVTGASPADALGRFDREHLVPLAEKLEKLRHVADGDGTPGTALRGEVDGVFQALVDAKCAFRQIDGGARALPEEHYYAFELVTRGMLVQLRVLMASWEVNYQRRIQQLIKKPDGERFKRALRIAVFVFENGPVNNQQINQELDLDLSKEPLAQAIFDARLLFPFIKASEREWIVSSDAARRFVYPQDLALLEAMQSPLAGRV